MRTLILGTNLRGLAAAARLSLDDGDEVTVFDSHRSEPPPDLVGRVIVLGKHWSAEYLNGIDRVVTSPWFPQS